MVCVSRSFTLATLALCGLLGASSPGEERRPRARPPDPVSRACRATQPMAIQLHTLRLGYEHQRQRHRPRPYCRYQRELH